MRELNVTIAVLILFLLGLFIVLKDVQAASEVITLREQLTDEQKAANMQQWEKRQANIKSLVDGEIARSHSLAVEVAKHQVSLDIERAGASATYVSAFASNRNDIGGSTVNSTNTFESNYENSNR